MLAYISSLSKFDMYPLTGEIVRYRDCNGKSKTAKIDEFHAWIVVGKREIKGSFFVGRCVGTGQPVWGHIDSILRESSQRHRPIRIVQRGSPMRIKGEDRVARMNKAMPIVF